MVGEGGRLHSPVGKGLGSGIGQMVTEFLHLICLTLLKPLSCVQNWTDTRSVSYGVKGDEMIFRTGPATVPIGVIVTISIIKISVYFQILLGCFPPPDTKLLGFLWGRVCLFHPDAPRPGTEPGTEQAVYAYLVGGPLGFILQMEKWRPRRVEGLA